MFVANTATPRNFSRMFKLYFLLVLLAVDKVVSLEVRTKNNPIELKLWEKLMKENPELAEVDPIFFQDNINFLDSKSLLSKNIYALIIDQLTKMSNFPTLVATNISEKCRNDSKAYYNAKLLLANWANLMFESTGQLFVSGNVRTNGLFDQCINVQAEWTSTSFAGKYCTVFLDLGLVNPDELVVEKNEYTKEQMRNKSTFPKNFDWLFNGPTLKQPKVRNADMQSQYLTNIDLCIPSSCSMEDFRNAVAQLIGSRAIETTTLDGNRSLTSIVAISDERFCYTKKKINATPQFNGGDITMISAFSIMGTVVFLATLWEFWNINNNRPIKTDKDGFRLKALHSFSMITNCRNLLSTKSAVVENLGCLNGIRVLSMLWIIQFHSYFFMANSVFPRYSNEFTFYQDALTWQVHGILNSSVAVDNFFFMSGLLVACSLLRELDRNKGRFNIGLFYLNRYLRLTPVYAFILGFLATLLAYVGSGPYWRRIEDRITACQWNWWNNLLYINNYVFSYPKLCMGETWYLACDMQMFIFSPLFIYLLWKWWKVGVAFAVLTIVTSITGAIFVFINLDLPAMNFFTRDNTDARIHYDYYIQSWARCPTYILGILLGWVLHRLKKTKTSIAMNKYVVVTGWIFSVAISLAVSYGMVRYLDPVKVPKINDVVRVSYGTLHRLAWAVSLAWIVFACIQGYGGVVNQFLSWKPFIPLSRLTYVVYLTHQNYLLVWHAVNRKPYYYTGFTHTEHFFGTVLMAFLMAFIICLVIELPFLNLEKLLLPNPTRNPPVCEKKEIEKMVDKDLDGVLKA